MRKHITWAALAAASLCFPSCGGESFQLLESKATLLQARTILEQLIGRLNAADTNGDGQLSQTEAVLSLLNAWMEWQAAQQNKP